MPGCACHKASHHVVLWKVVLQGTMCQKVLPRPNVGNEHFVEAIFSETRIIDIIKKSNLVKRSSDESCAVSHCHQWWFNPCFYLKKCRKSKKNIAICGEIMHWVAAEWRLLKHEHKSISMIEKKLPFLDRASICCRYDKSCRLAWANINQAKV